MRAKILGLVFVTLFVAVSSSRAQKASAHVNCDGFEGIKPPQMLLSIWAQPPKAGEYAILSLKCGEKVDVLGGSSEPGWWRVRAKGKEGVAYYAVLSFFKKSGTVYLAKALGYRVLPYQQTTYLRFGSYSANTTCYGNGMFISSDSWTSNLTCDTTYQVPTVIPVTWGWTDVYNYVETSQGRYVIACRANWRFSKCSALIPDAVGQMQIVGGKVELAGVRGDKLIIADYDVLQFEPKAGSTPSSPKQ